MDANLELIRIVLEAAATLRIDVMLIGAAARDYWQKFYKISSQTRITMDIDFACQIMAWPDFQKLSESLQSRYGLHPDLRKLHTLWLREELSVDLVPFGGVTGENGEICWPPQFDTTLCVLGYDAAQKDAAELAVGPYSLKIIRPHWLTLLKLQSYSGDTSRTKDLVDFYFLTDHYFDCIDEGTRIYRDGAPDGDLLQMDDFDTRVAGAVVIGRDCRRANREIALRIMKNLANFNRDDKLTMALACACRITPELAQRIIAGILAEAEEKK